MNRWTISRPLAQACLPLFIVLAAGCQSNSANQAGQHGASHGGAPHWSYTGDTGPAHWGSLSPEYSLCAVGRSQSPINITETTNVDLPNIGFHYEAVPVDIINNGHTVQVNYKSGSWIDINGSRYDLAQFHFHSPSEHTIAGKKFPAEMHLVHKSSDGRLAVIGVLLAEGANNPKFEPVWRHLPAQPGKATRFDDMINAADLLPADVRTLRYQGSLTTPPGTEGVSWFVMTEPVTLSKEQIAAFRRIHDGNARPTQPLNGRTVQRDTSK
jgi:carbonic anhydrase